MGERGLRPLRASVDDRELVLARLSRSDSLSFEAVASSLGDMLVGDEVSCDVVAWMVDCLCLGCDAVQMSEPPRPLSLKRARAGDMRGYLRLCGPNASNASSIVELDVESEGLRRGADDDARFKAGRTVVALRTAASASADGRLIGEGRGDGGPCDAGLRRGCSSSDSTSSRKDTRDLRGRIRAVCDPEAPKEEDCVAGGADLRSTLALAGKGGRGGRGGKVMELPVSGDDMMGAVGGTLGTAAAAALVASEVRLGSDGLRRMETG